ncbi:unnamed protein product [Rangifer tarandus platyrhynchus]|uniref:Uncharacterized protein n=1 Tax=Rangifer tarandus platyrhynchus TaxID=3082113 RepID=A0ACB1MJ62_RANTA
MPEPPAARFLWHLIFDPGLDCGLGQALLEDLKAEDHGGRQRPAVVTVIYPYHKAGIVYESRIFCEFMVRNDVLHKFLFGDLSVLAEAAAERQGDVGQVHGGVREALGAAVGRRTAHRLGGLGAGQRVRLGPLPGAGLRLAFGEIESCNLRFQCLQVIQVNIIRPLVLASLVDTSLLGG